MDTKALRQFGYGVYLVTARDAQGRGVGCVVNTGMQLTSDPYRVMVAVNRANATYAAIKATRRFAVTCLTEAADMGLVGTFGFQNSADVDKFAGFETAETSAGIPYVVQAAGAVVECEVLTSVDVGTHEVIIGDVTDAIVLDTSRKPMTYAYYHGVLKGTTPPKASAFIADELPVPAHASPTSPTRADDAEPAADDAAENDAEPAVGAHFAGSGGAPSLTVDIEEDPAFDFVFEPALKAKEAAEASETSACEKTGELPPIMAEDIPDPAEPPQPQSVKHHFRCMLCGHVVETDLDELPSDFRCPMCGAGADRFVKID